MSVLNFKEKDELDSSFFWPKNQLLRIELSIALKNAKKTSCLSNSFFLLLAERTGLEPATPGVTGRYSNQLNYHS